MREVEALRQRFDQVSIADKSRIYNVNLVNVLELDNQLALAEVAIRSALQREESRGAHARTDFPERNDADWLKHTLATRSAEGVSIDYKPVTISHWQPVERTY
jgi:succinate dehydrogenase / fumarate reductase flavoprotein subunit